MSDHPSAAEFDRLLAGGLPSQERAALDDHVEQCERCQAVLAGRCEMLTDAWQRRSVPALTPDVPASFLHALKASPPPAAPPGAGRPLPVIPGYDVLEELGRGGMGVVYKARQVRLNRPVALKMMLRVQADLDDRTRFQREAEAMARLQHPNIVAVFEVGEHDGQPFFTMELLDGGSLAQKVVSTTQAPRAAAELVEMLARAVQHAHEHQVIHRDLKPANVLLNLDGTPKITDFGLAKQLTGQESLTPTEAMLGTPGYMAPEQAPGSTRPVGPPADVYALGAVLYRLLTGRPPFLGNDILQTILQTVEDDPVPPRQLNRGVPRDLETICLNCLHKEPHCRYASSAELADDLRRFLEGDSIRARPPGLGERTWKWARRRPAVAAVWGVSAVLLLGLAAAVWRDHDQTLRHVGELSEEVKRTAAAKKLADDQRGTAERRKTEAERRKKEAEKAQEVAEEAGRQNLQRFIRLTLAQGRQRQDEGDLLTALLYHAEALTGDDRKAARRRMHELRLATGLRQAPTLVRLWPHPQAVTQVVFSPDGRAVLTAGADGAARLFDVGTGKERLPRPLSHERAIHAAAFSADGKHIATAGDDQTVRLWEAATGKSLHAPLKVRMPAFRVAFAPDGRSVLAVSGNRYVASFWQQRPDTVIPQPGGRMLRIPGVTQQVVPIGYVQLWEVGTGQELGKPLRQRGWINAAAFSPDGKRVVTAGGSQEGGKRLAQVWDVAPANAAQQPLAKLAHRDDVHWATFSPDGRAVLTASGPVEGARGEAQLWDVSTGKAVGRPMRHAEPVVQAWFSPDGRLALTASADETARVWDAQSGEPITPPLRHRDRVAGAWFDPTGRRVLTTSWDGTARLWDAHTGELTAPPLTHAGRLNSAAFSPDGRLVVTADRDGLVRLWDLAADAHAQPVLRHRDVVAPTGRIRHQHLAGRRTILTKEYLGDVVSTSAAFSPDGRFVVSGVGTRVLIQVPGGGGATTSPEVETQRLCVWQLAGSRWVGAPLPHQAAVTAATVSPDGRMVLTAGEGGVRLWELTTGKPLAHRPPQAGGQLLHAAFVPDGRCLMVTTKAQAKPPTTAEVRDVGSNALVAPAATMDGHIDHALLSADGGTLVALARQQTGGNANNPRLEWLAQAWNLKDRGKAIGAPLRCGGVFPRAAVSADGARVVLYRPQRAVVPAEATADEEAEALLWHVRSGKVVPLRHAGAVTWAAFSSDGKHVATASADRTARVWDAVTGSAVSPPLEHRARVNHVAFGGGGLVATASNDRTARVWDATTGEPVSPPLRHRAAVTHAAFGRDRLVTSALDGTARVWDLSVDGRPDADLMGLARLLAGHRIDARGGLTALDRAVLGRLWQAAGARPTPAAQAAAWHREQSEEAEQGRDWAAVVFHLDRVLAVEKDDGRSLARRGHARTQLGIWQAAADDYARAAELGNDVSLWYAVALLRLDRGDGAGYRRACVEALNRFGETTDPAAAVTLARMATLAINAVPDPDALERLLGRFARGKEVYPEVTAALGALAYRAGRHQEAKEKLKTSAAPADLLLLAMVEHRLGQTAEAKKLLDRATAQIDAAMQRSAPWRPRAEWRLLRAEAEALLGQGP